MATSSYPHAKAASILKSAIGSKLAYSPDVCRKIPRPRVVCIADFSSDVSSDVPSAGSGPRAYAWDDDGGQTTFVAFRGTVGWRDLQDTLDARMASYAFCGTTVRVHAGMLGAFSEMEDDLTDVLRSSRARDLTFVGHSKGGSHAQFAAAYYSSMFAGRRRVTCHTFGAPRVGDAAFAAWYSGAVHDSVVMIDDRDPIARLPPAFAGYHGTSDLAGTLVVAARRGPFRAFSLENHDMEAYLKHAITRCGERFRYNAPPS